MIASKAINQFPINPVYQQQAVSSPLPPIHHDMPSFPAPLATDQASVRIPKCQLLGAKRHRCSPQLLGCLQGDGTGEGPLAPGTLLSPGAPAQKSSGDLGREKEGEKEMN